MKLWLDDFRTEPFGWARARTAIEAIAMISDALLSGEKIEAIGFDHDLGVWNEPTGHDVSRFVLYMVVKGHLPRFEWSIQSINPAGAKNIRDDMLEAERIWSEREKSSGA